MPTSDASNVPVRRIALSIADMQHVAAVTSHGSLPEFPPERGLAFREAIGQISAMARCGMQEIVNVSDDLLLIRTDFRSLPLEVTQGKRWEFDTRGWLCLHFRLDGWSQEETSDGERRTLAGERFFLSASVHRHPFTRELLGDSWRTVFFACRPSFVMRELQGLGHDIPNELRRFQAGDVDVDFWFTGQLTSDMRLAVAALLRPAIQTSMRSIYLRAKAVELACLAVEQLRRVESVANRPLRLTQRDLQALQEAGRLLRNCNGALVTLEMVARQVGINRTKLALGFKQVFGVTVGEYLREHRLDLAREALEQQTRSVGEVAAMAGYCDAGSFTKAFRARYGSLPSLIKTESSSPCLRVVKN